MSCTRLLDLFTRWHRSNVKMCFKAIRESGGARVQYLQAARQTDLESILSQLRVSVVRHCRIPSPVAAPSALRVSVFSKSRLLSIEEQSARQQKRRQDIEVSHVGGQYRKTQFLGLQKRHAVRQSSELAITGIALKRRIMPDNNAAQLRISP